VPEPAGSAFLAQEIEPDDYRGRTVTFRAELRTAEADGRAGLALRAASPGHPRPPRAASPDPREDPANHIASATGTGAWTQYEVTVQIPADANLIRFGVFLNGGGQVELRHPELALHPPGSRGARGKDGRSRPQRHRGSSRQDLMAQEPPPAGGVQNLA